MDYVAEKLGAHPAAVQNMAWLLLQLCCENFISH
jgi:hypothetical protein